CSPPPPRRPSAAHPPLSLHDALRIFPDAQSCSTPATTASLPTIHSTTRPATRPTAPARSTPATPKPARSPPTTRQTPRRPPSPRSEAHTSEPQPLPTGVSRSPPTTTT